VLKYPRFEYSGKAVIRAGKVIAGDLVWNDETEPKIREAFQIANSWRNSHAYPMHSVRSQVIWHMHKNGLQGTSAARLKRMQAIRRKLRREDISLHINQLQDLGGVRAILRSIAEVRELVSILQTKSHHELREQDNYIDNPKADGYRSHHLMFNFRDRRNGGIHDGRRIELQLRTRLQHSWATAVEAIGLFRGEDLKGGEGSPEWLRLFVLMSAEFAVAEGCPEPSGALARYYRIKEIKALDQQLDATTILDNLSHLVKWSDEYPEAIKDVTHFLISYDNATNEVRVQSFIRPIVAVSSYDNAEFLAFKAGWDRTTVLVAVDQIENLKLAYPNYFGDVQLFKKQLIDITKGKQAREYTLPPRETVPPPHKEKPELAWLRRRKHIRWK
jgi:Region found in RelA / SpoT proteins